MCVWDSNIMLCDVICYIHQISEYPYMYIYILCIPRNYSVDCFLAVCIDFVVYFDYQPYILLNLQFLGDLMVLRLMFNILHYIILMIIFMIILYGFLWASNASVFQRRSFWVNRLTL